VLVAQVVLIKARTTHAGTKGGECPGVAMASA